MPVDEQRAHEIFLAAVELQASAERAKYIDKVCGADLELLEHIRALFETYPDSQATGPNVPKVANTLIELPAETAAKSNSDAGRDITITRGTVIAGRYKIIQRLGAGGMGEVWMAEQTEPVRRKVAVKIIKTGTASAQVLARFEAERQALAMMDHPNIAKVLDAGETDGSPYFVMELVKGIPMTKFCDEEHLAPRQRLELFIPICHAVQHAHQKGVIHRDLKPSNILIGLYDGKPIPKVIDFGIAKATSQKLTEKTLYTEVGQIIGTLEYMPPEQAELNNLDIDTRADVYALGVILYELLTGATPFSGRQLRDAGLAEMLRIIREVEPPKPSTKLSSSDALPSIAANRKLEPRRLTKLVSGDLDWIVMKCLEKDRTRRYETASALARDVERHLADEAVEARPPSLGYRARKFVRKHRGPVIAALLLLIVLVAGVGATVWQAGRAERADLRLKALQSDADLRLQVSQSEAEASRLRDEANKREKDFLRESMLHNAGVANFSFATNKLHVRRDDPVWLANVERGLLKAVESLETVNREFPGHAEHAYFLGLSYISLAEVRNLKKTKADRESALALLNRAEPLFLGIRDADPKGGLADLKSSSEDDGIAAPLLVIGYFRRTLYLLLDRCSEGLVDMDRLHPEAAAATPVVPPGGDVIQPSVADLVKAARKKEQLLDFSGIHKESIDELVFVRTIFLRGAEVEQSRLPWSSGPGLDHIKAMRLAAHLADSRGVNEEAIFNAACAFAVASAAPDIDAAERDRRASVAVGYLEKILKNGYFRHPSKGKSRRSEMVTEKDFASLRGRVDFQRVFAESQLPPPELLPQPRSVNR